ncbi:MAG: xanthine dehydrogenase family protein molybdopterin-binding subunit [Acidobacteriota bacterium]|nr:xanthine dehydrogenase family protein molybdopterin-binding subunit [Acidobacteriota bacterium]
MVIAPPKTKEKKKEAQKAATWVGQPIKRREDPRLLTGRGTFVDDITMPNMHHAAILRSPRAHARVVSIDTSKALDHPGVLTVLTGKEVGEKSLPFPVGVTAPFKYYSAAVDKVRYVGEPMAVVVASDRYVAEDALELIEVEYDPLPPVVKPEDALDPDAAILHEELGNNIGCHRLLDYGEVDKAFEEADLTLKERFVFPRYSSLPLETYAVIADYDAVTGVITVRSNFMGPFSMHAVTARALNIDENKLRFIVPSDIGGSFGIKSSIYPYIVLISLATMKAGRPIKWIEDRQEHLLASSCQTDRVAYREVAVRNDGTLLGIKSKVIENVGAYLRAPEPACTFRPIGNFVGPYKVRNVRLDAYDVMTNKCPTGPNRGYGCQQIYFEQERMMDRIAEELQLDPMEVRLRNLIPADEIPYTTPMGGIYDSGDYQKAMDLVVEMSQYEGLKKQRDEAQKGGRLFGIGIATGIDPSVSNMGYITVALPPEVRAKPGYLPKSGSAESATIQMNQRGKVSVSMGTTPQGQGHETVVSQIVADELGITPEEVLVIDEFDTAKHGWSISSGTYASRFASVGTSAAVLAARKLKKQIIHLAAALLSVPEEDLVIDEGTVISQSDPEKKITIKRVAGTAHWNLELLPDDIEAGLQARAVFRFPSNVAPDAEDRVNSSNTYGFMVEICVVEVDRDSGEVKILDWFSVHDAGTIINPMLMEGQIYGGALHGIGGALFEELTYDDDGQMLAGNFMQYVCPTAVEAPKLNIGHICSPSPLTPLGSKGAGESTSETAPAAIANAVADALRSLDVNINELPLNPKRVWSLIHEGPSKNN